MFKTITENTNVKFGINTLYVDYKLSYTVQCPKIDYTHGQFHLDRQPKTTRFSPARRTLTLPDNDVYLRG